MLVRVWYCEFIFFFIIRSAVTKYLKDISGKQDVIFSGPLEDASDGQHFVSVSYRLVFHIHIGIIRPS